MKIRVKAAKVRELLARRNLSQNALAGRLKITSGYCSQLMNGGRTPSPLVRERMMRILSAEFDDLFQLPHNGEEKPK